MLKIALFAIGWLLFVAAQAQNSIRSNTNGLDGWNGFLRWLRLQAVNLATRAFVSGLLYSYYIQQVTTRIHDAGLAITGAAIAGFAGYSINGGLYQIFGFLPWLRVEVSDLAPPANAQIQPEGSKVQTTGGAGG